MLLALLASPAATELPAVLVLPALKANPALLALPFPLTNPALLVHPALLVAMALLVHLDSKALPVLAAQLALQAQWAKTADPASPAHLA